ncbi:MSHA biogenesis protein MshQ [Vibrio brasiliensis]|uniref:DUF6701 domain-containing protein n=1 Tax=Vibrio brasiliensis TaxID=170652 RepID=UPI001EFC9DD3|nr:DUF6701 domain-containing protein [Vibrio brasiliensis]MCG9650711.1 MSHA biogenesis protein MshQ [Vibrio brasiliensis]
MRVVQLLLASIMLMLFSGISYAACKYQGNKDFTVSFTVVASNDEQSFFLKQGSHGYTIWYTQDEKSSNSYIFNEQDLVTGETYQIRIVSDYDSSDKQSELTYYRNDGNGWRFIETKKQALENGNHNPVPSDGVSDVECAEGVNPPPVEIDICDYVPEGLQSNFYSSTPAPRGSLLVTPFVGTRIYPTSDDPKYSFLSVTQLNDLCEYPNGSVAVCTYDSSKTYKTLPVPTGEYTVGNSDLTCESDDECSLSGGYYKDIIIKENAKLILSGGEYWFNELKFAEEDAQLEVLGASVVHYKKIYFEKPGVKINQGGDSYNLLLIGHGKDSAVKIPAFGENGNYQLNAFFYVDPDATIDSSGFIINGSNNEIRGGITAHSIAISGANNMIYPMSCSVPTVEVSQIVIKPYNYHLTCETGDDQIVEVHVLDSDGNYLSGYQPTLIQENGNNLSISFIAEANGIAQYRVTTTPTSTIGDYDLKASLTAGGQIFEDTDQIKYVPYKFEVEDQYVIAGQNNQASVSVKACSNSDELITLGYTGSPTASFSYQRPSSALVDTNDFIFSAELTDSNRDADFIFKESGHIRVTMTDNSFVCDDDRCPVEGGALKGQFDVYSRPWKIAICNVAEVSNSSNLNSATTTGTPGFMPSGDDFTVSYIPIVHGDSKGNATDECAYPQTGNYGLDNGPLNLTYSVTYPTSSAVDGIITPETVSAFDSDNLIRIVTHNWSEVGTIQFTTGATYLNMDLDSDQQEIGRFYPKFFNVVNTPSWDYPSNQSFAYMNQPFNGVSFDVEALNAQEQAVQNYASFDSDLTAGFVLFEPDFTERFNSPTPSKQWALTSQRSIGTFTLDDAAPSTDCESELCWEKAASADGYEDGPFNGAAGTASNISITDTGVSNRDPVDYQTPAEGEDDPRVLTLQPDIRFGRIELDSVGGTVNSELPIPLRVEFWDGSRFITNTDDSSTEVDGSNDADDNRNIWVEPNQTAFEVTFGDGGQIAAGQSRTITATHASDVRQQTQVWLELDNANNELPWLRYRWQDDNRVEVNGEQDPSSVVTFGIYRGNDRVIFRGEPGLTGQ